MNKNTINKLKLVSSGIEGNRVFFIVEKSNSFFDLFPVFLVSCGFRDIGVFNDYQFLKPEISRIYNKTERYLSCSCDIDLAYSLDKIFIFVRASEDERELIVDKFRRIAEF